MLGLPLSLHTLLFQKQRREHRSPLFPTLSDLQWKALWWVEGGLPSFLPVGTALFISELSSFLCVTRGIHSHTIHSQGSDPGLLSSPLFWHPEAKEDASVGHTSAQFGGALENSPLTRTVHTPAPHGSPDCLSSGSPASSTREWKGLPSGDSFWNTWNPQAACGMWWHLWTEAGLGVSVI